MQGLNLEYQALPFFIKFSADTVVSLRVARMNRLVHSVSNMARRSASWPILGLRDSLYPCWSFVSAPLTAQTLG